MKLKFYIVMLACAAGIGYVGVKALSSPKTVPQSRNAPPALEVNVLRIEPQAISLFTTMPGRTSAFRLAEIRPQVNGIIQKFLFVEGSDVVPGQELYQIDPAPYKALYNSAKASLLKAKANRTSIDAKANRYKELVKIGAISQQDCDDITASLAECTAQIALCQAELAAAKINLDYTKVVSPIAGRIGKSHVSVGALVTANQESPLAIVQQLDPIYVDVTHSHPEQLNFARKNKEQLKVLLVTDWDPLQPEKLGTFQFSDANVDPDTGTVQLRCLFENPDHELLPGSFVRTKIEHTKEEQALLVPQSATIRQLDSSLAVWVVNDDNRTELRPIKVTHAYQGHWLVTDGIKPRDRVVVAGMQKLSPNAQVLPIETVAAR